MEEIALVWHKECNELRQFATTEREVFQQVVEEITSELTRKDQRIEDLEKKIENLENDNVRNLSFLFMFNI